MSLFPIISNTEPERIRRFVGAVSILDAVYLSLARRSPGGAMKLKQIAASLLGLTSLGCEQGSPEDALVGAWRLVSWQQETAAGVVDLPYGEMPEGQIIYTSNGQMSAHLMNPDGSLAGSTASGADEILGLVVQTYFAYYGTYTLDEAAGTVTHHVRGSLAPSWVGTDRVRAFEFLGDNRLQLTAVISEDDEVADATGTRGPQVLVWERIGPN